MTEFLLLFFVFVGELGLAAVVYLAESITKDYALLVFFAVYLLQFITSTIQGGISDHGLRKKSLLIAFNAVLLGQIFFILSFHNSYMLMGAILLYGLLGNITPIARAALVDTQLKDNFRLSVGLSTIAIAVGWVLMAFISYYLPAFIGCIVVTIFCFICNFLVIFIRDKEDREIENKTFSAKRELQEIKSLLKHSEIYWGLLGYLIAETAFYLIFARGKGQFYDARVRFIVITWVLGYIVGAISQNFIFRKSNEKKGIICGSAISVFSMFALIVFNTYQLDSKVILGIINSLFSLGFGFFIPCIFSIISKRHQTHLQGKIYGLVDAVDSLALIIAVFVNHVPLFLNIEWLMISSLILTIIALNCFMNATRKIHS